MRLALAARYFDRVVCEDAYDAAFTFRGQFDLFDESRRDGMTVARRILSTAPDVTLPPRRTLRALDRVWIVGERFDDAFGSAALRSKYVIQNADILATVRTLDQALAGSGGFTAYTDRVWVKDGKEVAESSQVFSVFNLYFAPGEAVLPEHLILFDGRWHLAKSSFVGTGGLRVVACDELPEPVLETATYAGRNYDPLTDTWTVTGATFSVLRLRHQSFFEYASEASPRYGERDLQLVLAKSAASPKAGDRFLLSDGTWETLAVQDRGLVWSLHVRPV